MEKRLSYVTLEAEEFGGTVAKYPRQKLVMTSPVEFPMHGKFNKLEIGKEELLEFWRKAAQKAGLKVHDQERVEHIQQEPDGAFTDRDRQGPLPGALRGAGHRPPGHPAEARHSRRGPAQGHVQPDRRRGLRRASSILVVGGGDSAVEAAMGLAYQKGNKVTLSYRKDVFSRLKERNDQRIRECMRNGKLKVVFNSQPVEIREQSVVLQVPGGQREIPNDYVWVFAGGTPPNAFLEKVGVRLGQQDLTAQAAGGGARSGLTRYIAGLSSARRSYMKAGHKFLIGAGIIVGASASSWRRA